MNIVFWAIVVGGLILLWFILSPLFKYIGGDLIGMFERAWEALTEESEDE
jgi:hypothetical protein